MNAVHPYAHTKKNNNNKKQKVTLCIFMCWVLIRVLMILEGTTDLVDLVNDQGETRFSC